ncbi:MAG: ribosome biogenesis GTP-binding protein YihA/YsxC [Candidatus Kapaibacteriales bacterium]
MKKEIFESKFLVSASHISNFPDINYPEISFSGRSNVGKSSLINSIASRRKLAYTSATPGKTETLNFFLMDDSWCLVDMPGYGFVKKGSKYREKWQELNISYLAEREQLILSCVLIDSRHDPQKLDIALIELLENARKNYLVVLTKCDKIKPGAIVTREKQLNQLLSQCGYAVDVLPYSSVNDMGRSELIGVLKRFARGGEEGPLERVNIT